MDSFFQGLRRIDVRRSSEDGWIGGVCAGLGHRLGLDPVVVRAALVLLGLFFGLGVTLYLLAWLLIPDSTDQTHIEKGMRSGDGGSIVLLVASAVVVLGGLPWWGGGIMSVDGGNWLGWSFAVTAVTALIVWGLWAAWQRRDDPGSRQTAGIHGHQPYTGAPATPYAPAAPTRAARRTAGFATAFLATGLALISYGALAWAGGAYDWPGNHQVVAIAGTLGVLGAVLVAIGLSGRRSGFPGFLAALVLALTLLTAPLPAGMELNGRIGDEQWHPSTVQEDTSYHLGMGEGRLDLGGLDPAAVEDGRIEARVAVGSLHVLVPDDLTVRVIARSGIGDITIDDNQLFESQSSGGFNVKEDVTLGAGPVDLTLEANVGIGQITVDKE